LALGTPTSVGYVYHLSNRIEVNVYIDNRGKPIPKREGKMALKK
jgi:hypothetical protein